MFTKILRSLLVVLACCMATGPQARADQHDPQLEPLFKRLHAAPDAATAAVVEQSIWQLWLQHTDPKCRQLMQQGIGQLNTGELAAALATYNQLVKLAPDYAEAWNKRATVQYLLHDFAASELDIQQTLQLEPFHFGALSGRGLVKLAQRDYKGALAAFSATLEVYPQSISARNSVEELEIFLRRKSI